MAFVVSANSNWTLDQDRILMSITHGWDFANGEGLVTISTTPVPPTTAGSTYDLLYVSGPNTGVGYGQIDFSSVGGIPLKKGIQFATIAGGSLTLLFK